MADALRLARRQLRRACSHLQHCSIVRDPCGLLPHHRSLISRLMRRRERLCRRIEALTRKPTVADVALYAFRKTYVTAPLQYEKADFDLKWVDPPVVHEIQRRALRHEHPYEPCLEYSRVPVERVNVRDHIVVDGVKMTFEEVLARPDWRELLTNKDEGS